MEPNRVNRLHDGVSFLWWRPVGGFRLYRLRFKEGRERVFIGRELEGERALIERYQPFREAPDLLHQARRLARTEKAVLEFCNRYGVLRPQLLVLPRQDGTARIWGQFIDSLTETLESMERVWQVWWAARYENWPALERLIEMRPGGAYACPYLGQDMVLAPEAPPIDGIPLVSPVRWQDEPLGLVYESVVADGLVGVALWFAVAAVAARLKAATSYGPLYVPAGTTGDKPSVRMAVGVATLEGALWLMLARTVAGELTWQVCTNCKRPFPVGPGFARLDKKTCSDACRQQLYRRRLHLKKAA